MVVLKQLIFNSLLNFLLFSIFLIIKRQISPSILFYEGIFFLLISTTLLIVYYLRSNKNSFLLIHRLYSLLVSFFLILAFHTTAITIVDRSISVFMISQLSEENLNSNEFKLKFIDRFAQEGIDKRINEQVEIGNFFKVGEEYMLTKKGKLYSYIFKLIQILFNTDKKIFEK